MDKNTKRYILKINGRQIAGKVLEQQIQELYKRDDFSLLFLDLSIIGMDENLELTQWKVTVETKYD